MRTLVAWAGDQSPNLGVRALAQGSADLLRSVWPDAEIEFMDFGQRPSTMPWGRVRSLVRERVTGRFGMMEWLDQFDVYWDTRSGDSFADIYGLDRHTKMGMVHDFAVQAGARAVLAPQTIGPFDTRRGRMLARRTLRRSSLVFARDPISARAASELGRPVDRLTSDLVFAISEPVVTTRRDVLLNVSGLLWGDENSHVDGESYRAAVREIIDGLLARGRSVTLLPHVIDSPFPDTDAPVTRRLVEEYDGRIDAFYPESLDDVRGAIGGAQLVIGARMHACLNALSTGVPALAMAYSRKFQPLMDELGWDAVVSLREDGASAAQRVLALADRDDLSERALAVRDRGREAMRSMAESLKGLL